jgi:hypothetical protein
VYVCGPQVKKVLAADSPSKARGARRKASPLRYSDDHPMRYFEKLEGDLAPFRPVWTVPRIVAEQGGSRLSKAVRVGCRGACGTALASPATSPLRRYPAPLHKFFTPAHLSLSPLSLSPSPYPLAPLPLQVAPCSLTP